MANASRRKIMVWNGVKDELLIREVLLLEPYQFKPRTKERGKSWKLVAEHLNEASTDETYFKVDARAVRERFDLLIAQYLAKQRNEEQATGISPERTPLDDAIFDALERMKVCEEEINQEQESKEKENSQAEDLRKKALETFAETKARKAREGDESAPAAKRRRSSGSDTLEYLREKAENDRELRKLELENVRQDQQMRAEQQSNFFASITAQMQLQQQQNPQFMAVIANLLQNSKN